MELPKGLIGKYAGIPVYKADMLGEGKVVAISRKHIPGEDVKDWLKECVRVFHINDIPPEVDGE